MVESPILSSPPYMVESPIYSHNLFAWEHAQNSKAEKYIIHIYAHESALPTFPTPRAPPPVLSSRDNALVQLQSVLDTNCMKWQLFPLPYCTHGGTKAGTETVQADWRVLGGQYWKGNYPWMAKLGRNTSSLASSVWPD